MTEDEAKTKWCPFAKASEEALRQGRAIELKCIASACMAWRLSVVPASQENAYNREEAPEGEGWQPGSPGPRNRHWWRTTPEQLIGFCGLAGAPQ